MLSSLIFKLKEKSLIKNLHFMYFINVLKMYKNAEEVDTKSSEKTCEWLRFIVVDIKQRIKLFFFLT